MRFASAFVLLVASVACAAPPEVPRELKCEPGQLLRIPVKGEKIGSGKNFTDDQAFFDELLPKPGERRFVFQATKPGVYVVSFVTVGEGEIVCCTITVGAPIPPKPPDPPTPPDPPKPPTPDGPLRVIFVYESGAAQTPAQQAVMFGAKVREYLDSKSKGWRRFDKDADAANEKDAELRALWGASKGHVTSVPCVVVGRGSKVEILPLPADEDAAVELFKKYTGGK